MTTAVTVVPAVNIYKRKGRWDKGRINAVRISDITYLRTGDGWLYLAAITDAHSRRIFGWAMDSHMGTFLVEHALRMAYALRGEVPNGLVFHADRGTEFTSNDMFAVCQNLKVVQLMGRMGVY